MYAQEIKLLLEDLQIEHVVIDFIWHPGVTLRRKGKVYGTQIRMGDRHTVKVATGGERKEVLDTLAHELRHVWQYATGTLDATYKVRHKSGGWHWSWTGSMFVPGARQWSRCPYRQRPHEIDARAYALDACARLFDGKDLKVEPYRSSKQIVQDLFLFS